MAYLVIFFTSLLLTIFFIPYLINFLTKVRIVDTPDQIRRIHEGTVPRMGGIIIYFMVMINLVSFYGDLTKIRYLLIGSVIIVSLGIFDDIIGVNWDRKFLLQSIVGIFLIYFFTPFFNSVRLFGFTIPYPLGYFTILVLIVGGINAINLMDGLDGLVSGFSLLVTSVTFIFGYYYSDKLLMILSVSMIGSLIGFLKFNAFPARIFLGDTGSQSLGFFLVSIALLTSIAAKELVLDLTFAVIILGVPIVDTLKVIFIRAFHKKNLFLADKSHIHHILFGMKIRHKVTVFILQGFSFLYAAAAIYYLRISEIGGIIGFILISVPFLFVNRILDFIQQKIPTLLFRDLYAKLPEIFITFFLKVLLPIVSFVIIVILLGLIPVKSNIGNHEILLSIAFIILLLMYSIIHYQKNKQISEILVFINLIVFLLYSNYSETIVGSLQLISIIRPRLLLTIIIIPTIVFFLFFKERILHKKTSFLAGIDLIILVFIVLLTVSSGLMPQNELVNVNMIIFHSFLLYIFYKVLVTIKVKFRFSLFYLSFIIPISTLIFLLFSK